MREKREKRFKKGKVNIYEIECVKYKDHVRIVIDSFNKTVEVIIALTDNSRYAYIGLTGEHCIIRGVDIKKQDTVIDDKYIPRIANEVSYIDRLVGDVPNVQIDGYRTASTEGILIPAQLEITYHMMTLPTAWLIWHCSSVVLFYSDDGKVNGPNYKEYALVRLDGEYWNIDKVANNEIVAVKQPDFVGWDEWKAGNKKGVDIKVHINRKGNRITMSTENLGLSVKCTTSIYDKNDKIYVALSGDQCALTDIRIRK